MLIDAKKSRVKTRGATKKEATKKEERGYILLTLLLFMALLVIAAAVIAPSLAFEIKRDREEELVHRGVQYSRAIRTYASKTGRYPLKLEDLQDTGGVRYIRKLYKDPITGGEFKLLHMGDLPLGGAPNLNSPQPGAGANPGASVSGNVLNQSPNSAQPAPNPSDQGGQGTAGSDATKTDAPADGTDANGGSPGVGSGGVIFGVASRSKSKTIREFNKKNHYNDWLFFYYPPYGGTLLTGPTSLTLTTTNASQQAPSGAFNQPQGQSPAQGLNPTQNQGPVQNQNPQGPQPQ